jgi:membrane protein
MWAVSSHSAMRVAYAGPVSSARRAEINVVRVNRMHPRSLLTPFTDNVILTAADRRAYSWQARAQRRAAQRSAAQRSAAQRSKGFQHVSVHFDPVSPAPEPADPEIPNEGDESSQLNMPDEPES